MLLTCPLLCCAHCFSCPMPSLDFLPIPGFSAAFAVILVVPLEHSVPDLRHEPSLSIRTETTQQKTKHPQQAGDLSLVCAFPAPDCDPSQLSAPSPLDMMMQRFYAVDLALSIHWYLSSTRTSAVSRETVPAPASISQMCPPKMNTGLTDGILGC